MNITHAVHEEVQGDRLEAIFNRQKELMEKYHDIEARSGLMQTEDCPVNLDDKRGQARIKDFSWRVMEEVGEALDADMQKDIVHFKEELIDGLHFLTELTILTGNDNKSITQGIVPITTGKDTLEVLYNHARKHLPENLRFEDYIYLLVMDLGMMCNCLKNKPWKQTNMVTDKNSFNNKLIDVWIDYFQIMILAGLNDEDIVDTYLKKSQVNKFRQRSNY